MTSYQETSPEEPKAVTLVYTCDEMPGYRRKRWGRGFAYLSPDGSRVVDETLRERFRSLAIPPAWADVWISPYAEGHIQAVGRDSKGRKQYIYHPQWEEIRDRSKFRSLSLFGRALPGIRERVDRDLRKQALPREKVLALAVRLLDRTLLRVGNVEYARKNRSYGLTTLKDSHVDISGSRIGIVFNGKGGKRQVVDIRSRRLAKLVRRCQDLPGQRLFQYKDGSDEIRRIDSEDVNGYLKAISGKDLSAKDFRTWGATVMAAEGLQQTEASGDRSPKKKQINKSIRRVSRKLGNTPAVTRKYYVHPRIIETYEESRLWEYFHMSERIRDPEGLSAAEKAVLLLLDEQ